MTINCKYYEVLEQWPGFYNLYTCEGTAVNIGNLGTIEAITGAHLSGKNESSVTNLIIYGQFEVKTVPLDLYKFFPNLEAIYLSKNPIKYVGREHLYGLSKLKTAIFIDNQIEAIGNDLFEYQPNQIEAISFSYNPLKNIGLNVFSEMSRLRSFHTLPGYYENCYKGFVENDVNGAARMIAELKLKCFPTEEMILGHKFNILHKSFENLLLKLENDFESLKKRDAELSKSLNQVKTNLNSKFTSLTIESENRFEKLNSDLAEVKTRQDTIQGRIEKISTECCATTPFFKS